MGKVWITHAPGIRSKIRPRDGRRVFYAMVRVNGKRHTERAGSAPADRPKEVSKALRAALAVLGRMQSDVDAGKYVPVKVKRQVESLKKSQRWTWAEFVKRFLADYAARRKRPEWFKHMTDRLTDLKVLKGYVDQITRQKVERHLAKRQTAVAPATVNHELRFLRTMLNVAKAWGIVEKNVTEGIKPIREGSKEKRLFDTDDKAKLLTAAAKVEADFLPVVQFDLLTGMRVGELDALEWSDVDLEKGTARLRETKSGNPRTVPLCADAVKVLKSLPSRFGKGLVFEYKSKRLIARDGKHGRRVGRYSAPWRRICKEAKVAGPFHGLRHTFASDYIMRGGALFDLCKICGWSDYAMVERVYGHLSPDYLAEAIGRMNGLIEVAESKLDASGDALHAGP